MKRFNLLLVNTSADTSHKFLRTVSKVFRRNFIFEVNDLEEAEGILQKLHIDLMVVDMDGLKADLVRMNGKFPNLPVMGLSTRPAASEVRIDPLKHKVIYRREFQTEFTEELKNLRRDAQEGASQAPRRNDPAPAASTDFKNFFKLLAMN